MSATFAILLATGLSGLSALMPLEVLGAVSLHTPAEGSYQTPVEGSYQTPVEGSYQTPAESSYRTQAPASYQRPAVASQQRPTATSHQRPTATSHQRPTAAPFERTEEREPCANYQSSKQPLFGDLHVHTSYSYDSYISSQRNDPWDAYRYAKGEAITLPDADGVQRIQAQLQRPLDFSAVTDHGEFLGEINVCTGDSSRLGYWFPLCGLTRSANFYAQLVAAKWWVDLLADDSEVKAKSLACSLSDCDAGGLEFWRNTQQAAEDHYDRSAECDFTSFVGYEFTDAPDFKNMHRNVIFRNQQVVDAPITTYDTGSYNFPLLWQGLREQCIEGDKGCDVMTIPHNPNLSGGLMFPDPKNQQEIDDRLFFEPVVEIVQHKAASECRFDRLEGRGVGTTDELCDFEQVRSDNLTMLGSVHGEIMTDRAAPVSIDKFNPRNMLRNVLKDGVAQEKATGINPFKMGFIGSTDTHSATAGGAEEDNFVGHIGRRDAGYRNIQDHFFSNPGGLAVVWAEENSRDSIFHAIRNKETYATSGTRPIVRFFAGDYAADMCQSNTLIDDAYARGVPMGGDIKQMGGGDIKNLGGGDINQMGAGDIKQAPSFLVTALKDSGANATDLQRIQIIKGWVDAEGETHEQVFDVAGIPDNGASVDPNSCAPVGTGFTDMCRVWKDPSFNADENAFYYVRVLENPSCRWSTRHCQAAGVNPFATDCKAQAVEQNLVRQELGAFGDVYSNCCIDPEQQPFYKPVIQERAWTSPIWYTP